MELKDQFKNFNLPNCSCSENRISPVGKICLEPSCGELLCVNCDSEHQHQGKMVRIYKFLEILINKLSLKPIQLMTEPQQNHNVQNQADNNSVEKQIEFLSKNLIRIEKSCKQIQSNLDNIKLMYQQQTDPTQQIIKDALMNMFLNQQSKEVIQQELLIVAKQINMVNFGTMQFETRKFKESEEFGQRFGKYKQELEKHLNEAEKCITQASQLKFQLEKPNIPVEKQVQKKGLEFKGFDNVKEYFQNSGPDELNSVTDLKIYLRNQSNQQIGEEGAQYLSQQLSRMTELQTLYVDLYQNNIGDKGAEAVAAAISKLTQLTQLDIHLQYNNIGDKGAEAVAAAISKLMQLTQLTIQLNGNKLQNPKMTEETLKKQFSNIKKLLIYV